MRATIWDTEWAAEKASEARRYLADFYPECAASPKLYIHQDGRHGAAVAGDQEAYLEALTRYMRAGRDEALRMRKGVAA